MSENRRIIGRFAPTPSGPLHMGSLVAALGSYLSARAQGGDWLVRIEDLDPPREVPGAADGILRTLDCHGLHWDGEVWYQSRRNEAYAAALEALSDHLFFCTCTRESLRGTGGVYPGTCHHRRTPPAEPHSIRIRTEGLENRFTDAILGEQHLDVRDLGSDPIIRRKDGYWGYQLAVVVDDQAQRISEVVRGADLLHMTPVQIWLHRALGRPEPTFRHLPVVRLADGRKLSKQNGAPALDDRAPEPQLREALGHLGFEPPLLPRAEMLAWAVERWAMRANREQTV